MAKRRATPVTSIKETFEVGDHAIALRYPSKGKEGLPEDAGAYRLVVHGASTEQAPDDLLPPGARLEVDASGTATLDDMGRAVRDA